MRTVSVIIPSYNHEQYIEECIDSILNQTFQDFEIVITDDRSVDNTVERINSFSDSRIKLFEFQENQGASAAANNSFANSTGKYIAMLSSDDIWLPNKLEEQVSYLEAHEEIAAVYGKVQWINEDGNSILNKKFPLLNLFDVKNRTRFDWLNYFFYRGNCLCHPCSLIRRNCLEEVGYLNPSLASLPDMDLWVRLCLHYDIYILDQELIKFRYFKDNSNASGNTVVGGIRNIYEHRKILDNFLNIDRAADLVKIFPDLNDFMGKIESKEEIKFLLGIKAIETEIDYKVLWGLDVLYNYLQYESANYGVAKNINFSHRDFIDLTGSRDVFHTFRGNSSMGTSVNEKVMNKFKLSLFKKIKIRLTMKRKIKLIKSSGLFDEEYYLAHYPDVSEAGIDSIEHYILFGAAEGRKPSSEFDSIWYLETYQDVKLIGMNPLIHYILFGETEGRKMNPTYKKNDSLNFWSKL